MMEGMRCLVWLLLVIGMACGVEDGCAAVVRREVAAAGGGVVPGLGVDLTGRPRVRAMNYYYDEEGNRSLVIVTNSQGAQTRLDHLQWDRQNRLVGYAMFDAGRRCVFEAAYAYDHRARRVYRAERDERNGGGGAWDAAVVTFLGGTSVQEFATTVTPASGGWRYAGYDPYAATGRGGVFSEYGTYVAVAMGGVISPRSAMEGAVVPASAVPRVHIARGVDMGGGVGGLLYTERPGADGLRIHGADARGDVVSQVDRNGEVRWASSYAAYGARVQEASAGGAPADRFRANSKEEDPTGLLNEGFRYRDLETGTFISRDPLGFVDGPNVYCYVGQNPWSAFDPEGLYAESGHYYTTFLVARAAGCDVRGAQMLAEYSQEPDENRGLTALELTAEWVAFTYAESPADLRFHQFSLHMLHGKRGGKLESARSAIRGVVADRSESLAVRGAFIHALGDSYSHTYLGGGGDRLRDYVPEIESAVQVGYGADTLKSSLKSNFGHGGDFTKPDQIGERPKLYMSFVADLYAALGGKTAPEKSLLESSVVMEDLHKMVMSNGFKAANGHDQEVVFFRDLARKHGLPWTPMPPESHNADHGFWAGIGLSRDQRSYNYYMIRKKQDEVVKKMSDQ
jgi:RHS repeat-associated protein